MKIAIAVDDGKISGHFGHAELFRFYDADSGEGKLEHVEDKTPPVHTHGVIPAWLINQGVDLVISRGMGQMARAIFADGNVECIVGTSVEDPDEAARAFVEDRLEREENTCNRPPDKKCGHKE